MSGEANGAKSHEGNNGRKPARTTPQRFVGTTPEHRAEIDPVSGKPIRRVYEANPKHSGSARTDARGRRISREPTNGAAALANSMPKGGNSPARVGRDPQTGEVVEFRRHLRQERANEVIEYYHGYVPKEE